MDKPFSPSTDTPFVAQNYFMQIILTKLICKRPQPSAERSYTFSIYKGSRELDTTSVIEVPSNCHKAMALDNGEMNFMVNNYNPESSNNFRIVIACIIKKGRAREYGEYFLSVNDYIDQYNISQNGSFDISFDLCEDFSAEAEFYINKSQYGLHRFIKSVKNPKPVGDNQNAKQTAPRIMRQRITDVRKKMDEQAEQDNREGSREKHKRFNRFSPRRQPSMEKKQAELFTQRRTEQEKKSPVEAKESSREPVEEKKKIDVKKETFVKRDWIIPAAQKISHKLTEKTKVKRKSSKQSNEEKTKAQESKMTSKSKQTSAVTEPSFLYELIVSPKILLPLLVIIVAALGYFLFMPASQLSEKTKLPKSKKVPKAEGKSKVKGKK